MIQNQSCRKWKEIKIFVYISTLSQVQREHRGGECCVTIWKTAVNETGMMQALFEVSTPPVLFHKKTIIKIPSWFLPRYFLQSPLDCIGHCGKMAAASVDELLTANNSQHLWRHHMPQAFQNANPIITSLHYRVYSLLVLLFQQNKRQSLIWLNTEFTYPRINNLGNNTM